MKFCSTLLLVSLVVIACTTNAWAGYADIIIADAPVAYYTFDNVTGTTVPNVMSATDYWGTMSNCNVSATPATSIIGGSSMEFDNAGAVELGFNSSGDTFGGDAMSNGTNYDWAAATVEAWIKADSFSNFIPDIFGTTDISFCHLHAAVVSDTGNLQVAWVTDEWNTPNLGVPTDLAVDTWYHLAVTVSSTATESACTIYVNGQEVASDTRDAYDYLTSPDTGAGKRVLIGNGHGSTRPFDGLIDEVAVYNKALTDTQIAAHYTAGTEVPEPSTVILLIGGFVCLLVGCIRGRKA